MQQQQSTPNWFLPSTSSQNVPQVPSRERANTLQKLEEAVLPIPSEDKSAYLEALQKVPKLVDTETDPIKFVRVCDGDLWAASRRICLYWKRRKEIFRERAFLPLTLTGHGALTRTDILCLQGGFPCVLPPTTSGQQIVFNDRRQWTTLSTCENRVRCCFYLMKKMSEDPRSQTEGILCFILLVVPRVLDFDQEYIKTAYPLLVHAAPLKFKYRILCHLPKIGKNYMVQKIISSYVQVMVGAGMSFSDIEIHIEKEEGALMQQLIDLGLSPEGIPTSLGGTWAFTQALDWCRELASQELDAEEFERKNVPNSRASRRSSKKSSTDAGATQKERRKAANIIYSRRKRERRQFEQKKLQDEHDQSMKENKRLKQEQQRLEALLRMARNMESSLKGRSTASQLCGHDTSFHQPNNDLGGGTVMATRQNLLVPGSSTGETLSPVRNGGRSQGQTSINSLASVTTSAMAQQGNTSSGDMFSMFAGNDSIPKATTQQIQYPSGSQRTYPLGNASINNRNAERRVCDWQNQPGQYLPTQHVPFSLQANPIINQGQDAPQDLSLDDYRSGNHFDFQDDLSAFEPTPLAPARDTRSQQNTAGTGASHGHVDCFDGLSLQEIFDVTRCG